MADRNIITRFLADVLDKEFDYPPNAKMPYGAEVSFTIEIGGEFVYFKVNAHGFNVEFDNPEKEDSILLMMKMGVTHKTWNGYTIDEVKRRIKGESK